MDEITLTDEQKQAIIEAADKIVEFISNLVEAVTEAVRAIKSLLNSLLPDGYEWTIQKRPPRKIGTPHPGFTNIKAIRPLRLC